MIDPNTPIEKIAEMCESLEDLNKLLQQCNYKDEEDTLTISQDLLQEAIFKTRHLKSVKTSDIQRLLHIGYPEAAKIYELIKKYRL